MSFENILGQEPATRFLKKVIKTQKMANGYIFFGPEGVGKKKTAIAFAKALNCIKKENGPCGECLPCKAIENGTYPDLILLRTQGPIQTHHIDTIRAMQSFVNLRSFYEGWKIVIMDEADRMTEEAANALLKILEEPPPKTMFILVTSRPENLFETVLSRCQPVKFLPLRKELQEKILNKGPISDKASKLRNEVLTISPKNIFQISQLISQADVSENKQSLVIDILNFIFCWWRDVLFVKQGLAEILNRDYEEELKRQAKRLSLNSIWENIEAVKEAQQDLYYQVNPRLILDTLFLTISKCTR
jgi:DNA polymerase-3 subunit delta'